MPAAHWEFERADADDGVRLGRPDLPYIAERHEVAAVDPGEAVVAPLLLEHRHGEPDQVLGSVAQMKAHVVTR